jgi:hypothetical protein
MVCPTTQKNWLLQKEAQKLSFCRKKTKLTSMDTTPLTFTTQKQVIGTTVKAINTKIDKAHTIALVDGKHNTVLEEEIKKDIAQLKKEVETLESILNDHKVRLSKRDVPLQMKEEVEQREEIVQVAWHHYGNAVKFEALIGQERQLVLETVSIDFDDNSKDGLNKETGSTLEALGEHVSYLKDVITKSD